MKYYHLPNIMFWAKLDHLLARYTDICISFPQPTWLSVHLVFCLSITLHPRVSAYVRTCVFVRVLVCVQVV